MLNIPIMTKGSADKIFKDFFGKQDYSSQCLLKIKEDVTKMVHLKKMFGGHPGQNHGVIR